MTVKELKERLETLDDDIRVLTDGYEEGFRDIDESFDVVDIALNVHTEWYYGPHALYRKEKHGKQETIKAITL